MKLTKPSLYDLRVFVLSLLMISLSFHSPPLTTISLVLFFLLGLSNIKNFHKASLTLKIFSLFGLLYFFSSLTSHLLYDEKLLSGQFTKNFFFLLIPISFQLSQDILTRSILRKMMRIFCVSVMVFSFLGLIKILYLYHNQLVSTIFYEPYGEVLKIHTTYFSLLVSIAYFYIFNEFLKSSNSFKSNLYYFSSVIYFLAINYLLSARIGIIAIGVVSVYIIIIRWKTINKYLILIFGFFFLALSILFISSGYSSKRILNTVQENQANKSDSENRVLLWKNVLCAFNNSPNQVLGAGLEDSQRILNDCYQTNDFFGFKSNYNAHNQYLQNLLENGLLGATLLVSFLLFLLMIGFKYDLFLLQNLVIIFALFFFTESILERQLGITIFLIFIPLALSSNHEN